MPSRQGHTWGVQRRRVDPWAAAAVVLTVVMVAVYVTVIAGQGGDVALWYLAVLVLGAGAAAYGTPTSARHRRPALVVAAVLLVAAGLLGILSIGMPVLVAGVLCLVASARVPRTPATAA
jgi:hypothetical protein